MPALQDSALIVLGILACFMGYSIFRDALPLWGFILGGWLAYILLPTYMPAQAGNILMQGGVFFAGGLAGAMIAKPLYYVIVFLSGGVLGGIMGVFVGAIFDVGGISSVQQLNRLSAMTFPPIPQTAMQYLFMFIFAVGMGVAAINFQKFMVTASSAFMGSAALVSGLGASLAQFAPTATGRGAVLLMSWLVIGLVGLFIQFRLTGED